MISLQSLHISPVTDSIAKSFVLDHHYSNSFKKSILNLALFSENSLLGIASFGTSNSSVIFKNLFNVPQNQGLELTRFVLAPNLPRNTASFFLAKSIKYIKTYLSSFKILISYADPLPRLAPDNSPIHIGHVGYIYQAANFKFIQSSYPKTTHYNFLGQELSNRLVSNLLSSNSHNSSAISYLINISNLLPHHNQFAKDYISSVKSSLNKIRHHGLYLYALPLHHSVKLPDNPFPKSLLDPVTLFPNNLPSISSHDTFFLDHNKSIINSSIQNPIIHAISNFYSNSDDSLNLSLSHPSTHPLSLRHDNHLFLSPKFLKPFLPSYFPYFLDNSLLHLLLEPFVVNKFSKLFSFNNSKVKCFLVHKPSLLTLLNNPFYNTPDNLLNQLSCDKSLPS